MSRWDEYYQDSESEGEEDIAIARLADPGFTEEDTQPLFLRELAAEDDIEDQDEENVLQELEKVYEKLQNKKDPVLYRHAANLAYKLMLTRKGKATAQHPVSKAISNYSDVELPSKRVKFEDGDAPAEEPSDTRLINYDIFKNKGLTRKRKKVERNTRVKNKAKFEKKLKAFRRTTPTHKQAEATYGGETTGIRDDIVKSVRIK